MVETADVRRRLDLRRLAQWGGIALLAASLAYVAERLSQLEWSALAPHFSGELVFAMTGALILFAFADHALARGWAVLADPAQRLHPRQLDGVYGQGVLAKYLPGSVFQYVSRHIGGRHAGLDHAHVARSSAAEIGAHIVASMGVAAACLLLVQSLLGAAAAAAALAVLYVVIRGPIVKVLILQMIAFTGFAIAAALIGWVVLPVDAGLARFAALFLLAWLAGFVVPVAPGGLGVREAALLALASGSLPEAGVLAAILALRIASIGGDLAYGLIAFTRSRVKNP